MLPKITHHSYIIEGEKTSIMDDLFSVIEDKFEVVKVGNPDFFYEEYVSLGIDDARRLKDLQSNAPFVGDKKIFVISVDSITNEAQNALLKVFEEPTPGTHFFFVIPSISRLLPTFLSRAVTIKHKSNKNNDKDVRVFVEASMSKRLDMVKGLIEEKDKSKVLIFLKNVADYLRGQNKLSKLNDRQIRALELLSKNISYLGDRSSSLKLILESLALTL